MERAAETVDESETVSANFFGPTRSVRPRGGPVEGIFWGTGRFLRRITIPPYASETSEHRPRHHVLHLGAAARPFHLGRPAGDRREPGHGTRLCAALLRRDLPLRPPARPRRSGSMRPGTSRRRAHP